MNIQFSRSMQVSGLAMCLAALMLPALGYIAPGAAQTPAPKPAPSEDPAVAASRQAFEALPEEDRKDIQRALIWVVPYNGAAFGTFGRQTYNGIIAFQKMTGVNADGILTPQTAAALKTAANGARSAAGFKVVQDGRTGIEIGVPLKVLTRQGATLAGTRWQSADGKITLDTRKLPGGAEELQTQFERAIAPASKRKVTYKFQRPDFFVVSGDTGGGEFYIRYALGPDGLRGFTFGYDKSVKADAVRLMIAIADSFVPVPDTATVAASATPAPTLSPAVMPARAVAYAGKVTTGVRVGPRQVMTIGLACQAPVIGGSRARLIKQEGDLALLEVSNDKPLNALPLRSGPVTSGTALIAVSWDASTRAVAVASGSGESGEAFNAALQVGGRGGLVFDRSGAVAGFVGPAQTPLRMLAGVAMPSRYTLVTIKTAQEFIGGPGSFTGEPSEPAAQSAGAIASSAAPRVVDVVCP